MGDELTTLRQDNTSQLKISSDTLRADFSRDVRQVSSEHHTIHHSHCRALAELTEDMRNHVRAELRMESDARGQSESQLRIALEHNFDKMKAMLANFEEQFRRESCKLRAEAIRDCINLERHIELCGVQQK